VSSSHCIKKRCVLKDLKTARPVDAETNVIIDLHCAIDRKESDAEISKQLAYKHAGGLRAFTVKKAMTAGGCVDISATTLECVY
jgi:hypothetical protein